ncbi:hypothetical protein Bbelb_211330 [Branchiostoma belcheri]|nr:hypothetical protein Bbelb_211330 [Branchiostoma belcheri]
MIALAIPSYKPMTVTCMTQECCVHRYMCHYRSEHCTHECEYATIAAPDRNAALLLAVLWGTSAVDFVMADMNAPPQNLAKTGPDTPTTATTATTRKAISGREKRRSRPLASPRQDLILELQELQQLRVAVDCRCLSAQKRSLAVKKTDPPASLAKTRPDTPTTATTAVDCRCLSAQKRSLAVKKTDPPASLAKTRPDTPTTATTATTRKAISGRKKGRSRPLASPRQDLIPQLQQLQELQKLRVVRSLSYNIPFLNAVDCRCLSARKRSLAVKKTVPPASLAKTGPDTPTTATTATTRKAISGREKRRSRPLASPRQDLIPQLQQLQELQKLRVVRSLSYNIPFLNEVDSGAYRHRSDVKPLKKMVPPASLAKTRPDTPTTATTAATRTTTGTTATTRGGELRCLSAQKRSQAVKNTVPPASLAKTRPDTPTTGTTVTTATTRSRNLSYNVPFLKAVDSGAYLHRSDLRP